MISAYRFEHYELVKGEDGNPIELGRGAMGVTYKAFDVDLHRPVTQKVISTRYLNDESARLRFLREARAAASLRHPNVASVFHLGRTSENYFYAMEFVGGETLENPYQTLRAARGKVGARNRDAGRRRFGCGPQAEAKRAVSILPISRDAAEGPLLVSNLAAVYAWTNEPDLAFQELIISVNVPGGMQYGELKLDPAWDLSATTRDLSKF